MGCKVCGAGLDWSLWPEWTFSDFSTFLIFTPLDFGVHEYLCAGCHSWASRMGAIWDGKVRFRFTGFKLTPAGRIAYGRKAIHTYVPGRPLIP